MPPRSAKMNRFIFGFQRRVWWPKWTPASRSSRMETTAMGFLPVVDERCAGELGRNRPERPAPPSLRIAGETGQKRGQFSRNARVSGRLLRVGARHRTESVSIRPQRKAASRLRSGGCTSPAEPANGRLPVPGTGGRVSRGGRGQGRLRGPAAEATRTPRENQSSDAGTRAAPSAETVAAAQGRLSRRTAGRRI